MSLAQLSKRILPDPQEFTRRIIEQDGCKTGLDIGCGKSSYLSRFRPKMRTVGLDAFDRSLAISREANVHDRYILANIITTPAEEILKSNDGEKFDVVTLFDVIEHLPKNLGWELLAKCEALSSRFVFLQTPYGFLEQGPEEGNPFQVHLSGWFPHDFEGLGYKVAGAAGTRFFHGYAGRFKYNFPGVKIADGLLGVLLRLEKNPHHALNMVAWKDLRAFSTA